MRPPHHRVEFFMPDHSRRPMGRRSPLVARLWTWGAGLFSVGVCLGLTWLHFDQHDDINRAERLLGGVREARVDLAKGFLSLILAGDPRSPSRHEEGLALLDQAIVALHQAQLRLAEAAPAASTGLNPASFEAQVKAFRTQLDAWSAATGEARLPLEANLRTAFRGLESDAGRLDLASQHALHNLSAELDREFAITLGAAILLLAGLSVGVYLSERTQQAAIGALGESEQRYRTLVQNANSAILRWRRDGTISFFNEYAERLFGYRAGEVIGQPVNLLVPDRESSGEDLHQLVENILHHPDHYTSVVNENVCRDGRRVWMAWTNKALLDARGELTEILAVGSDITERKQAEELLRERNEELVRFVYAVSHDLKSPLVTIQTFLGYLEKDLRSGNAGRIDTDLGYIRRAAVKMLELLEELLELSRVGRKLNPPEDVRLQTLVQEALDLVAGPIAARGVQVRVTDVPVQLHGDRRRLLELFQNLIDNAVKFMGDQPAPQVEVGVEDAGQQLVIYVRDNGLGIDPRHQGKLFGLFEKLHPGTPGSGVGLALVKRIVEIHGGRVWADSAGPRQGATFRFTLAQTQRL